MTTTTTSLNCPVTSDDNLDAPGWTIEPDVCRTSPTGIWMETDPQVVVKARPWKRTVVASRVILVVAVVLYVFYCLVGWGPYAARDYVGTWSLSGEAGAVATLELRANGTAEVRHIPEEILSLGRYSPPDWRHTLDMTGTWEVLDGSQIWLTTGQSTTRVWPTGRTWGMALNLVGGGDPDNSPTFTFRRES